jgi:TMEM175 potassium channel family protein
VSERVPRDRQRKPADPARASKNDVPASEHRMTVLTDGVFAIALTLLVLDVRIPSGLGQTQLNDALRDVLPQLFAYGLSFAVIALFWLGHNRMFARLARLDGVVVLLNLVLLGIIALLPFPTTLIAEYDQYPVAVVAYAGTIAVGATIQTAIWLYASGPGRLLAHDTDPYERLLITAQAASSVVVFAATIPLAFVSTQLAEYSWTSLFVLRFAIGALRQRHAKRV